MNEHTDTLDKNMMTLAELKHGLNNNGDLVTKLSTKVERMRENITGEVANVRDTLAMKIDQIDKFYMDEISKIETIIKNDKSDVKGEINKSYDDLSSYLSTEIQQQKSFVTRVLVEAQAHRENIQVKYDEKLGDIKSVCSEYFTKYEKHLRHHSSEIKSLEDRMEIWVNKLIQP